MIRVFKSDIIRELLSEDDLKNLDDEFKTYKELGDLPDTFGRDVLYDHPNTLPSVLQEEISHIHLNDGETPWPFYKMQFQRTSDTHLVYCKASMEDDCYLLMTILKPNAHELSKGRDLMWKLASMAEKFRNKF